MLPKQDFLALGTIGTPVSPKISWKLLFVLTWRQGQVVLYPKDSNIGENNSFRTGRNFVVLKRLKKDNMNNVKSKVNKKLKELKESGLISIKLCKGLKPHTPKTTSARPL